jgi:phage tail-like protein
MGLRDSLVKATPAALTPLSAAPSDDISDIPLPHYYFAVEIDGVTVALFQKVSSIVVARKTDEITEGGFHEHTLEFPKHFSYNHIKFEVGMASSDFFYKWMMYGKEEGFAIGKDFVLKQKYPNGDDARSWFFQGAFPVKWQMSDLSITNSKAIIVEKIELSFNYFELE